MQIVRELDPLRNAVAALKADGALALVPTMGALHEGHLTLVREARRLAAHVAVSIFVNPRQFGPREDLAKYPRQLERDCELLEAEGVSLVWAPGVEAMYPAGYATNVSVSGVSEGLCGEARPGHFDGVATVVCKLFNQVRPDMALFGEKDWQQLAVIRRMARDLDLVLPHAGAIRGVPTVREADGLALSSRNAYLSPTDRAAAVALPTGMKAAIAAIRAGTPIAQATARLKAELVEAGFASVDYAEVRDAASLAPVEALDADPARLFVAARIGGTRLIDNMPV
ncbi:pantoate--beta-alanine ligase [Novosphingobium sp.]|uniref:pantoate--beta-alanine ligase n=1 Tax=Novosphingobium sp. TaxID=1874826 RepID=UPI0025E2497E|nr:pantoate--beta-alanine ligase [Novosphingobium sp.]MCC6927041.1 pantoate--beta-alanine ligase [Novosphingobium sp.]